ncbi:MAG: MBOAT family protein [Anaerolineales bacterium]|nr:MAG: MBOAT family protein [Anaerolineales bacterium]
MTLIHILVFSLLVSALLLTASHRWRRWSLLIISLVSVYWLQPAVSLRQFDFWFPTASLGLTVITWMVTRPRDRGVSREDLTAMLFAALLPLLISLSRFLPEGWQLTASRPPSTYLVVIVGSSLVVLGFAGGWLAKRSRLIGVLLGVIVAGIFIVLKTEPISLWASSLLRGVTGQSRNLAASTDLYWLGFSYIAFRLLHVLRDQQSGRLSAVSFIDFLTYVLFFPAITAGPIDRVERFTSKMQNAAASTASEYFAGAKRIVLGIFQKFVLADGLAIIALNSTNATLTRSVPWLWVLVFAFSLRLYFDFSGYTDVAIGVGLISGIQLPENFDRPYLKTNIGAFWNSWHMTLANWFRAYVFNPLTRALRKGRLKMNPALIILIGQLVTMTLIGLWHGVTLNFALWGVWHAIGLFVHNRWVAFLNARRDRIPSAFHKSRAMRTVSLVLTFNFVALGWVWFALPSVQMSWEILIRLFGGYR